MLMFNVQLYKDVCENKESNHKQVQTNYSQKFEIYISYKVAKQNTNET